MKTHFAIKEKILAILICLMVMMFGSSCARMTEEQKDTANRMTKNLFEGISQEDYAVFSEDFDATMLESMDEPAFRELTLTLSEALGSDYDIRWVSAQKTTVKGKAFGVHHYKVTSSLVSEPFDFTLFASEDDGQTYISGFSLDSSEAS